MTEPLTPANGDLRDFPHTPIFRTKLFSSEFHARATDGEWRAGFTLWLKAWDQVPAGSLPVDDVALTRLAELGRDLKAWGKVKSGALRGWILCTDGRMYHPIVAEGVNNALDIKVAQRNKTANARIAALTKKMDAATDAAEKSRYAIEIAKVQQAQLKAQSLTAKVDFTEPVTKSVTDRVTESKRRQGEGKERKGEGKVKGVDIDKTPLTPKGDDAVLVMFENHFWPAYPRKTGKPDALKAFRALKVDPELLAAILLGLAKWRVHPRWTKDAGQFIKHPGPWLRSRLWEDEEVCGDHAASATATAGLAWEGAR